MTWTRFYDLHSGGYRKHDFDIAYIELPKEEAVEYFAEKFSHPDSITCECCGEDYSVYEGASPPEDFLGKEELLVISRDDL